MGVRYILFRNLKQLHIGSWKQISFIVPLKIKQVPPMTNHTCIPSH